MPGKLAIKCNALTIYYNFTHQDIVKDVQPSLRDRFSCIEFHPDGGCSSTSLLQPLGTRSLLLLVRARLNLSSTLLIVVVPSHVSRRFKEVERSCQKLMGRQLRL